MAIDPQWIWIAVAVVAALVVIAIVAAAVRNRRSRALRDEFGPEYRHAVETHKSRAKAERELVDRKERFRDIDIRPLTAVERDRFNGEWEQIQARFVDRPTTAVVEADELISEVMRLRGYPMGDFETRAAELSVHHPKIVENYRSAHAAIATHRAGRATTEDLRQAMVRFRALFDELVGMRDVETPIRTDAELDRGLPREDFRPSVTEDEDRLGRR